MSDRPDIDQMRSELLHDLADEIRKARAERDANHTRHWVKDPAWTHKPSDDFGGCVE